MNPNTTDNFRPDQPAEAPEAPYGPSFQKSIYPAAPESTQPPPPANGAIGSGGHPHEGWRSIVSTLLLLALAPVIAISIAAFVIQSYQVEGASMQRTLNDQDRLIVDKIPRTWARITNNPYIPNRGDIIIFNQANVSNSVGSSEKQLIKRVIALPGERVVIDSGKITVYNNENPGGFNPDIKTGYGIDASFTPGNIDLVVPKNQVFVCGDNRQNSEDSRFFGPVRADEIVGKLVLRLLPFDKLQTF